MIAQLLSWIKPTPMSVCYKTEKDGVQIIETSYGFITYKLDKENSAAVIMELYVKPNCRGRGCSKLLLKQVEDLAKKSGMKTVITSIDPNTDETTTLRNFLCGEGYAKHASPVRIEFELYTRELN